MSYIIAIFCITLLGIIVSLFFIQARVTSPLSLHSISWFLVSLCGLMVYNDFIALTDNVFYNFIFWYVPMYLILLYSEILYSINGGVASKYDKKHYCSNYWVFIFIALIVTIYEIYTVGTGGENGFFLNLREASTVKDYDGVTPVFMNIFYPFVICMFAISFISERTNRKNKIIASLWMIAFAIGTMGKFAIITPIIVYLVIKDHKKKINKGRLLFAIPPIATLLLLLHFGRSADNDTETISTMIGTYIYSPLIAMSKLSVSSAGDGLEYTMRFAYAIMNKIGLSSTIPVETILPYSDVPVPTNVYTVMQPFYQDLGSIGVFIGSLFYGIFFSILYGSARRGNAFSVLVYALLSVSLLTSFFAETLITNISGNIKIIICLYLIWRFTVRKYYQLR
ncbi:oligosaccharide repeat unit polymerase [Escherichia sp. ESNIH1]|uniref:O-antigen polymerase n=1 Tax=Escherichia sp. ESNIH1 TaxID=1985876 RepID=UPI000CDE03D9|nr:O-antigen polymerase [Escherichia sp. ESNIH1]POU03391.1 oligosaccharide repeat unit polymerase [Escherichia sp. ESNIH1]